MTVIGVLNRAPGLDDRDVAFWAEACNEQANEIALAHAVEYTPVVFFSESDNLPADARILTIKPTIDVPDALGYHDVDGGAIFAEVKYTGPSTSVTMSHEICEEILDPLCNRWLPFDANHEQAGEACDRVEGDVYLRPAIVLRETRQVGMSNFLLPSAFDPTGQHPFDWLGVLQSWNAMSPGGYTILRDVSTGKVGNVFARGAGPRVIAGPHAGPVLAEKLAKRGSRLLRRLRG